MAISPKEADNVTPNLQPEIDRLEKAIDAHLAKHYYPGKSVRFDLPSNIDEKVLRELERKYRAVGWGIKTERGSCQRDGDWVYFNFTSNQSKCDFPGYAVQSFYDK